MWKVAGLSYQERMLIEQRVMREAKSLVTAYLLWLFVGSLGAHRFYIGRTGSAVTLMALFVLGWLTLALGVGVILLIVAGSWLLLDAFLIPRMISEQKDALREDLIRAALFFEQPAPKSPDEPLVAE
ncbi:TM2 domain-containing protein [Aurantimonas sp. A2-1-M11]|uniref:TM2 domain-containing protein n=1 Tax=Aurantimonas sp. A2-1-M11 TaxID=3113712 RepID=UPI002F951F44